MILDKLDNSGRYEQLHPLFKEAFDYLKQADFSEAETGKTELRGKDLFVMVSDSDMRPQGEAALEVHNDYIDIQLPISKAERFGWKAREDMQQATGQFDEERDILFFADTPSSYFNVLPGDFVVFFPEDGHAPCIGEKQIRKVVVKIKV